MTQQLDIEQSEAWLAFVDMRKAKGKRAPFTDLARKRILFELRGFQADGQDVEAILWTSVTNGWSGVFPAKRVGWQAPEKGKTVPLSESKLTQPFVAGPPATPQTTEQHAATAERLKQLRAKFTGAL